MLSAERRWPVKGVPRHQQGAAASLPWTLHLCRQPGGAAAVRVVYWARTRVAAAHTNAFILFSRVYFPANSPKVEVSLRPYFEAQGVPHQDAITKDTVGPQLEVKCSQVPIKLS